jgi:hypothetical protein
MTGWQAVLAALAPSIGVGLLFWWAIHALVNADRNERRAQARADLLQAGRPAGEGNSEPDNAPSEP